MTRKTFEIIMACKGVTNAIKGYTPSTDVSMYTAYARVIDYLSVKYKAPKEYYTANRMKSILEEAVADYRSTCDSPEDFDKNSKSILNNSHYTKGEQLAIALAYVEVRNQIKYVNGFENYIYDITFPNGVIVRKYYEDDFGKD